VERGEGLGPEAERYLEAAAAVLAGLPPQAREELLAELRDHLSQWCAAQGLAPGGLTYADVAAELGTPESLGTWVPEGLQPPPARAARRPGAVPPGLRPWLLAAAALPIAAAIGVLSHGATGHPGATPGTVGRSTSSAPSTGAPAAHASSTVQATAAAGLQEAQQIAERAAIQARLQAQIRQLEQQQGAPQVPGRAAIQAQLQAEAQQLVQQQEAILQAQRRSLCVPVGGGAAVAPAGTSPSAAAPPAAASAAGCGDVITAGGGT